MEELRGVSGLQLNVSDRYNFYSYAGEKTSTTFAIDIDELQDGKVTFNFPYYAAGHPYSVSVSYDKDDEGHVAFVNNLDKVTANYSLDGSSLQITDTESSPTILIELYD